MVSLSTPFAMIDQLVGHRIGNRVTAKTQQPNDGRYQITALLGKQTGRRTYLATDHTTNTSVVIKLMLFGPDFTWADLKLFEREAETLRALCHPALPQYLDSFEVATPIGKGFALVQTYIDATSIQQQVNAGRTFSHQDLYTIADRVLNILIYLHNRHPPVIHRDIKPSNMLLTYGHHGSIKDLYLIDFGSVKTTPSSGTMTIVGTYGYMPVEQFSGRALPASDLYSLGATLVYLASGKHPAELVQANLQLDFERHINLPSVLTQWIKQLTYADLSQRMGSAKEALETLSKPPVTQAICPTSQKAFRPSYGQQSKAFSLSDRRSVNQRVTPYHVPSMFNDIELTATKDKLSIQLLSFRLSENAGTNPAPPLILVMGLGWALVLLTVFSANVPLGFFLLFIMLLFAWAPSRIKKHDGKPKKSSIHLWQAQAGSYALSSSKLSSPSQSEDSLTTTDLDAVRLPVTAIEKGWLGDKLRILFNDGRQVNRVLVVSGSRREIEFLYWHISMYTDNPIQWWERLALSR